MMLPYAYVPSRDDLYLYEDHIVSWTNPTPGSAAVKRAVAWNPGSPLYGYRNSLQGINAKFRFWGTSPSNNQKAAYAAYNDPDNPANNPNFYNSFPPTQNLVSQRYMYGCAHCYGGGAERNPNSLVAGGLYAENSYLIAVMQFRWIGAGNQVLDQLTPYEVIRPYTADTANGYPVISVNDLLVFESVRNVAVTPLIVADIRNCESGMTAWMVDGASKVVRCKIVRAWVQNAQPFYYLAGVLPDGSPAPVQPGAFLHDSGSFVVVELKPPSSVEAGDGIAAILPYHIFSSPFATPVAGYDNITEAGWLANLSPTPSQMRQYAASRGYPMPARQAAWRKGDPATETAQQQILSEVD